MIDYRDPRPIFEQIAENYRMQIMRGILEPDEQIPSVRTLAAELSTNPNTVQKAYSMLEMEGYIYTVKGRGAFVSGAAGQGAAREARITELAKKAKALFHDAKLLGCDEKTLLKKMRELTHDTDHKRQ